MFARTILFRLKADCLATLSVTVETQILPLLRRQNGFQEEIVFADSPGELVTIVSLWRDQRSAEACEASVYPEVLKLLGSLIVGTPEVRTSKVIHSSLRRRTPDTSGLMTEAAAPAVVAL